MNDRKKNKYLIKNVIIFAIGNFSTKLISFFLIPLYTNVMTSSEYGIADLLSTICNFLVPLFTFNIVESVLRFSLDKENNSNKIVSISSVILLFTIFISLFSIPIMNLFKEYRDYSISFYLYLVTFATSQVFLVNLKGKEKLKLYSFGNFLYTLAVAIFNIIFLVYYDMEISGYFVAYTLANIILLIYSVIVGDVIIDLKKFDFDKKMFIQMIKYSVVLIPTSFMWWIMNFMDRVMVTNMISSSANGIYAVSYKIPSILAVLSSIFTQAWLFSAVKEKDNDNERYTNKIFNFLSFCTIFSAMFLLVILKPLFNVYVAKDFFIAWKYVPFLMIGYIFLTLSTFISTSYNVNKDSKGFLVSATVGACINIVLNFLLIPILKIYGAALATAISYLAVFIYRVIDTRKYIKIQINNKFICLIILSILLSVLVYIDNIIAILLQIIILIISFMISRNIWIPVVSSFFKIFKK